jgi:hypothetical protein
MLEFDPLILDGYFEFSSNMQLTILDECRELSLEQIVALTLYYTLPIKIGEGSSYELDDHTCVPMDRVEEAAFAYRNADYSMLKLLLAKMFTRHGIDFSVVTYEFASKVAPNAYRRALEQVKDGQVQMDEPGELTLLPIKHCRWCGLVRDNVLRLCQNCEEDQRYPVRTWFCGDECEQLAKNLHGEEHARHHHLNLGFESKVRVLEPETEPLKGAEGKKKKKKKSGRAKK